MTDTILHKPIKSEADVSAFFTYLIEDRKANFHPDDNFAEYINVETGKPSFTKEEAAEIDVRMNEAFDVAGNKVYDLGQACFDKHFAMLKAAGGNINAKPHLQFEDGGPISSSCAYIGYKKGGNFAKGIKGQDKLTHNEKLLLAKIAKKENYVFSEFVKLIGAAEYDVIFKATKKQTGNNSYEVHAWLPLAAIKALVKWDKEDVAGMSDYPQMVLVGDWSGIRDTQRTKQWQIFNAFVILEGNKLHGEHTLNASSAK